MFVRASTLVLAIAASAIAVPSGTTTPPTVAASQCDTSSLQCCNETGSASSLADTLSGLLGVLVPIDLQGLVGLGCTPITVIGTGSGAACTQQPVCCTNVSQNGLVNLGCSPVNLNL